jgi:hypothetical protein
VDDVADVSEEHAFSIFRIELDPEYENCVISLLGLLNCVGDAVNVSEEEAASIFRVDLDLEYEESMYLRNVDSIANNHTVWQPMKRISIIQYYASICLKWLRKTKNNLRASRIVGRTAKRYEHWFGNSRSNKGHMQISRAWQV